MTSIITSFDSQHEDMIHDAQMDYYGKRLATCSSDRTIRIHNVEGSTQTLAHTLTGHEAPVWQVAWAHPKFGSLLASCSYDSKVFVWREHEGVWTILYQHSIHVASVNSIAWAPHELGIYLACGSADGRVSVIHWREDGNWIVVGDFLAHQLGTNTVSWAPSSIPGSLIQTSGGNNTLVPMKRLATGGSDNLIKIWRAGTDGNWSTEPETVLDGHTDWVRCVSWAPNIGLPYTYLASVSQDKTALIWSEDSQTGKWTKTSLKPQKFAEALWGASWSDSANLLAISGGDNKVSVWKQSLDGKWENVSELEDGNTTFPASTDSGKPELQSR